MVSGVDRNLIIEAARLYATAQRGAIYWGMGISQLSHGTASALALIHLALLTGHIGRRGHRAEPAARAEQRAGRLRYGLPCPSTTPATCRWTTPTTPRSWEQAWNIEPGGLSRKRGLTTTEILSHAHPGGVRALYIMGENPMMTEPNLNLTRQHMQQLEFLVAQDLFINESGAFADVFLPAAVLGGERRHLHQHRPARAARAPGDCRRAAQARPDWQIICDLAQRIERRLGRPRSAGWDYAAPRRDHGRGGERRPRVRRRDL